MPFPLPPGRGPGSEPPPPSILKKPAPLGNQAVYGRRRLNSQDDEDQVRHGLQLQTPMEDPCCSCKLTNESPAPGPT